MAKAFGDLFLITNTIARLDNLPETVNEDTRECMLLQLRLDALTRINSDIGTWLEVEYFNGHHSHMIRSGINKCISELKRHMVALTYSYFPYEEFMDSMLAPESGELYKSIVSKVHSSPHAFERIANWKELYKRD